MSRVLRRECERAAAETIHGVGHRTPETTGDLILDRTSVAQTIIKSESSELTRPIDRLPFLSREGADSGDKRPSWPSY